MERMINKIISITAFTLVTALVSGQQKGNDWPLFRGHPDLSGRTDVTLPVNPKLLWSVRTGGRTVSSPVISKGIAYFGNNNGEIFAISNEGKVLWEKELETAIEAPPLIVDDRVIIGSLDGELRALERSTGELIWLYVTENQIIGSPNIWTSNNRKLVIVGSYDFYLHCVDPGTGEMVWKVETNDFINGTPAVLGDRIVFGGCDGYLRQVNPVTGQEINNADLGVYIASSPALSGMQAFVGSHEGVFYAMDLASMKVQWKVEPRDEYSVIMSTPAIYKNRVIVGSQDKYLYCYNIVTGKKEWEFRTGAKVDGSAVISGNRVLFGSRDGFVYILDLETGNKIWSFDTGSPVSSSPAVTGDRFYILTEDGRLLAFGK